MERGKRRVSLLWGCVLVAAIAGLLALFVPVRPAPAPQAPPPIAARPRAAAPIPKPPAQQVPREAPLTLQPSAAEDDVAARLQHTLESASEIDRIEAINGLADRGELRVLPMLEAQDLARDPVISPSVINAVGKLARVAPPEQREHAVRTLERWLRELESSSAGEAPGYVVGLVQALSLSDSPAANSVLSDALERGQLPLSVETTVATALGAARDRSARAALEHFSRRIDALPATTGFEESLRREAKAAVEQSLAQL